MALAKSQRQQLRQLMQNPQWAAFEQLIEEMCVRITTDSNVRDSEWETLKAVLISEGQVQGIRRLIQEAFQQASNEKNEQG